MADISKNVESASVSFAMKHAKKIAIFALLLPLVFFTWQVTTHIEQEKEYQAWRISVEGYDPRDILKGRFIRYQYAFPFEEGAMKDCTDFVDDCCLCLNGSPNRPDATLVGCETTNATSECSGLLRHENWYVSRPVNDFNMGLTEYYMDERAAKVLDKLLRSGEVLMSVDVLLEPQDGNGNAKLTKKAKLGELYINGRALSEMLDDDSLPLDK
jgi:hypothetical protein